MFGDPIFALIEAHKAAMAEYVRLISISSAIPFDDETWLEADAKTAGSYKPVKDAQTALLTTKPTTLAGAAAVLTYVASFWIEGNDSSERGLPVYETLTLMHDDIPSVGDGCLPMIADAGMREPCLGRALPPNVARNARCLFTFYICDFACGCCGRAPTFGAHRVTCAAAAITVSTGGKTIAHYFRSNRSSGPKRGCSNRIRIQTMPFRSRTHDSHYRTQIRAHCDCQFLRF